LVQVLQIFCDRYFVWQRPPKFCVKVGCSRADANIRGGDRRRAVHLWITRECARARQPLYLPPSEPGEGTQVSNITHFASKRCPITQLTKLQVWALAGTCIETSRQVPNGVHRSLVIRGLLTSSHRLTTDGRDALASCTLLSEKFREMLLAMPIVRTSRRRTRTAREKSRHVA